MRDKPVSGAAIEGRRGQTNYPEPFARKVAGRTKRRLGDAFGLESFGVNLTRLEPGSVSALYHAHTVQEELVYVLEGHPTVHAGGDSYRLAPGECMGFKGGTGVAHQLVNDTDAPVTYLEIGDRRPGDSVSYPCDDLSATQAPDGTWIFTHKDGTPY